VDQLAKQASELALRLATLSADGSREDNQALDAIEQLAIQVIKEVSGLRLQRNRAVGESSGTWRAVQPVR